MLAVNPCGISQTFSFISSDLFFFKKQKQNKTRTITTSLHPSDKYFINQLDVDGEYVNGLLIIIIIVSCIF